MRRERQGQQALRQALGWLQERLALLWALPVWRALQLAQRALQLGQARRQEPARLVLQQAQAGTA